MKKTLKQQKGKQVNFRQKFTAISHVIHKCKDKLTF